MKKLSIKEKNKIGYILIAGCVLALIATMVSAFVLKGETYHPDTFCKDSIFAHTIVVIDKTDPLSIDQQQFLLHYINREKNSLKKFEKFSIFALTENTFSSLEPIFSKCNPGNGEEANILYQNPRRIKMRFDSFFSKPLKENMNNLTFESTGSKSTIFEMIRELSFRDDFGTDIEKRTLIIFSDMMHHTSEYSHYKHKIDYQYFLKRPYANEVEANLNSVQVKLVYLYRNNLRRFQGRKHLLFWKDYFKDMGATMATVRNVR